MIRIQALQDSGSPVVLKIAGRLSGEAVGILQTEGERWLASGRCLVLDLSEVSFVDRRAARLLQGWGNGGMHLRGASHFVRELLRHHGLECN